MACDVEQIIEDSSCVFCMIPQGLQPYALLAIFCAIRDGDTSMACDPQSIIDEATCLQCKIPDGLIFSALVAVGCGIAQNGGGGGGTGGTGGVVNPDGVVNGDQYQTYYNSANSTFWVNTDGATAWTQVS